MIKVKLLLYPCLLLILTACIKTSGVSSQTNIATPITCTVSLGAKVITNELQYGPGVRMGDNLKVAFTYDVETGVGTASVSDSYLGQYLFDIDRFYIENDRDQKDFVTLYLKNAQGILGGKPVSETGDRAALSFSGPASTLPDTNIPDQRFEWSELRMSTGLFLSSADPSHISGPIRIGPLDFSNFNVDDCN